MFNDSTSYLSIKSILFLFFMFFFTVIQIQLCPLRVFQKKVLPWPSRLVGYSIVLICQGCGYDPWSGHIQELTNKCLKDITSICIFMFLTVFSFLILFLLYFIHCHLPPLYPCLPCNSVVINHMFLCNIYRSYYKDNFSANILVFNRHYQNLHKFYLITEL